MPLIRGQKLTKISVQTLNNVAVERNHIILQMTESKKDPDVVPKQSRIHLQCLKCNNQWDTKVYVYLQRTGPSLGCRKCFNDMIQNPLVYPNSPCISNIKKEGPQAKIIRRSGKKKLREVFQNSERGHIKNLQELIFYLNQNPNAYNNKVLELLFRNEGLKQQNKSLKFLFPGKISKHHVIPIHDGGSPDSWNIIEVTKKEHHELHELRYRVYHQKNDLKATYATHADVIQVEKNLKSVEEPNQEISVVKQKKNRKQILGLLNIPLEVSKALENELTFIHKDGYVLKVLPNTLKTTSEIKEALINLLPENHVDKERMLKNKTSANYIRSMIITKFLLENNNTQKSLVKKVYSAYGFKLL